MLPWIIIKPSAAANLFNLGSLIILTSFAVLWGPREFFLGKFLAGPKSLYAAGFLISLLLCIYFSVISGSYIMTFVCLIAEICFMLYFVASYFPGGKEGITAMLKAAWGMITSCCKKGV